MMDTADVLLHQIEVLLAVHATESISKQPAENKSHDWHRARIGGVTRYFRATTAGHDIAIFMLAHLAQSLSYSPRLPLTSTIDRTAAERYSFSMSYCAEQVANAKGIIEGFDKAAREFKEQQTSKEKKSAAARKKKAEENIDAEIQLILSFLTPPSVPITAACEKAESAAEESLGYLLSKSTFIRRWEDWNGRQAK